MADTMQLLTTDRETLRLRDQRSSSLRVPRRESAIKPVANTVLARVLKGLTLPYAVKAGITAAQRSVAVDTKWPRYHRCGMNGPRTGAQSTALAASNRCSS
jgi:hypothetical protein